MKALIFGRTGQVACELARKIPAGTEAVFLSRSEADLTSPEACAARVAESDADVVLIAAAFTDVDGAESDEATAQLVNGAAPGAISRAAAQRGAAVLHISTDYVFDGSGARAWTSEDRPSPMGAYGRSKLAGERQIAAAGGPHAILRTSWVFSAHGRNFVKTMLRLAQTRERLTVVSDQIGGPTAAADIAAALWRMADAFSNGHPRSGLYHFSGELDVSWADFAREIFAQAGRRVRVEDILSRNYPTPARRPANSRLDCTGFETEFGLPRPDWRVGLAEVLEQLQEAE